jgi:ankyrin repeat protein
MVAFLEVLCEKAVVSNVRFHVCFASRHYPNINMNRGLDLVLEGQPGHTQDITDYLNSKLKIGHSKLVEQIRQEVQKKASGVFMWVVLVVEMLNKEYDGGRVHALRKRLLTIPGDLHELFRDILTRDELHRNELRLCIQWILFSTRQLSPHELYYGILLGLGADVIKDLAAEDVEVTEEDMKRFILDCSKGLVEVVPSTRPTVQFIHESVRDFLLGGNGLAELWTENRKDFRGYSHDILKTCCATCIAMAGTLAPDFARPLPLESVFHFKGPTQRPSTSSTNTQQSAAWSLYFLAYAVQNVLHHADLAEEGHVSQLSFVEKFDWARWLNLSNLFLEDEVCRLTPKASPLYIFAENDLPNLIGIYASRFSYFELEDDRYGSPLYAAIITRSYGALRKFLELEVQIQPNVPLLRRLLDQFCSDEHCSSSRRYRFHKGPQALNALISCCKGILVPFLFAAGKKMDMLCENWHARILAAVIDRDETFALQVLAAGLNLRTADAGSLILLEASTKGWLGVCKKILGNGNVDINFCNSQGVTALGIASQGGHVELVKTLLNAKRVNVNSTDGKGRTPFGYAILRGYEEIAKLLIDTGEVNINLQIPRSRHTNSPLAIAAQKGYRDIARLLLWTGKATINSKDRIGRTPLSFAAERGCHHIVAILLHSQDIDVNSIDKKHRTPLSYAAEQGHQEVLKLLIRSPNINLNSADKTGWNPLFFAACRGHQALLRVLLQQDEVKVNSRSDNGLTALILAARAGHIEVVKLLLGRDEVDVNATTLWGVSALSMAEGAKHQGVVETLLASGKIKA